MDIVLLHGLEVSLKLWLFTFTTHHFSALSYGRIDSSGDNLIIYLNYMVGNRGHDGFLFLIFTRFVSQVTSKFFHDGLEKGLVC